MMRNRSWCGASRKWPTTHRDPDDEKGDEVAEHHLAKQRRPIEREKGADAAEGESRHETDRKGEAQGDQMLAVFNCFRREQIEMTADPLRCAAKQPFDARAQTDKDSEKQQGLNSSVFTEVCGDSGVALPKLVWQIRDCAGESNNVLADRCDTGVESLGNRLLGNVLPRCSSGLCFILLLQPHLDTGIGE